MSVHCVSKRNSFISHLVFSKSYQIFVELLVSISHLVFSKNYQIFVEFPVSIRESFKACPCIFQLRKLNRNAILFVFFLDLILGLSAYNPLKLVRCLHMNIWKSLEYVYEYSTRENTAECISIVGVADNLSSIDDDVDACECALDNLVQFFLCVHFQSEETQ